MPTEPPSRRTRRLSSALLALLLLLVVAGAAVLLVVVRPDEQPEEERAGRPVTLSVRDFGAKGDGRSDDTAALKRAFGAIPPAGGTVQVPPGTYVVSSPLRPDSNTRVTGTAPEETVLKGADIQRPVLDLTKRDRVVLDRLTITYDSKAYDAPRSVAPVVSEGGSSDVSITGCIIRDTPKQAVVADGKGANRPKGWKVTGNRFKNVGRGALIFLNGEDVLVAENTFEDTGDDAIALNGTTRGSVARNNVVLRAGGLLGQGAGIKVHGQSNVVRQNRVEGFVNAGIFVKRTNTEGAPPPADNLIADNDVLGPIDIAKKANQAGIQLADVAGVTTVEGNRIHASSAAENYEGIRVETSPEAHIVIRGNRVVSNLAHAPGKPGVALASSVRKLEITENTLDTRGNNVLLATRAPYGEVTVARNTFVGSTDAAVVRMQKSSAGLDLLQVLDNVSNDHVGPYIDLAGRPVETVRLGRNTIGPAVSLLVGSDGVSVVEDG